MVFPNEFGMIENVFEIPSLACSKGSFATEHNEAKAPQTSRPCNGFAPGANGTFALRPSGVLPVFFPYTTLDVIVKMDCVGTALRYVGN